MYLIILMWVLTSTKRLLRDKATQALYYVGCKFPNMFFEFTEGSFKINDPYIPERMLAASYGVAMARQHETHFTTNELPKFAKKLFELMFKKEALYSTTHILMRDYARHTIELALLHNPLLLNKNERKRIAPPFKDGGIRRWGKSKDKNKGKYRGVSPFGTDFNNYTMGCLVPKRGNYNFKHLEYIQVKSNMWWRIYSLGYSMDKFDEIDDEIARYTHFGREANGRKIERYGKKYCWIAWHEIAGFRQDKGLLKRDWDIENVRFTVDIDPSFPEEAQKIEVVKKDYLGRCSTSLPAWIEKGPTPSIKPYFLLNEIQGEKGSWVLLDGSISQEDLVAKRGIFIFPRGLLVKSKDFKNVFKYLKKQDLGGRWLPEIPEHYYTFAGEIPWCKTFLYNGTTELNFVINNRTQKVLTKTAKYFLNGDVNEETKEFKILMPISTYGWESHHSVVNSGRHAYILSKELCEVLKLSSRPQTFDLFDKNGQKASITLKWGEEWGTLHKLIYIRKDLLEKFLKEKAYELIWGIWGERQYKAKGNKGLMEFAKKHKPLKVFQKIISYRDIVQNMS